jgi:hypothetical protein
MYHCTGLRSGPGGWDSQEFWKTGTWKWQDCQLYASAVSISSRDSLLLTSAGGNMETSAVLRPVGLSQRKISMTPFFLLPVIGNTPTVHCSSPHKFHFMRSPFVLRTSFDYDRALPLSRWRRIYRQNIVTCVSHLCMYEVNYIRVCKIISKQLKSAHLPRSTLCGPRSYNNKSTYVCQLILVFWAESLRLLLSVHCTVLLFGIMGVKM